MASSDLILERLRGLHPTLIDLSLDRIVTLLDRLGRPQDRFPPVVHIAGTNGKGSTTAFVRAMAEAAGQRVHVYTSPHLVRFCERIRLAGRLIAEDALIDVLERVEAANAGAPITVFEITTAAAYLAFAETPADLCLVEVGLGGRYDATNVFPRPALSLITPVGLDHMNFLGDTLTQIAGEKAGVLKPGAPALIGRQAAEAFEALDAAAQDVGANAQFMGREFDAFLDGGDLVLQLEDRLLTLPAPVLPGPHQIDNAGLAAAAAVQLGLPESAIAAGLRQAEWPARLQRLTKGPLAAIVAAAGGDLWLDGAHNPHAAVRLAQWLAEQEAKDGRPSQLVIGLLNRKDARGVLAPLAAGRHIQTVAFTAPEAEDPEILRALAADLGAASATAHPNVTSGVAAAARRAAHPRVVILGSLYLAGEVLGLSPETWPV